MSHATPAYTAAKIRQLTKLTDAWLNAAMSLAASADKWERKYNDMRDECAEMERRLHPPVIVTMFTRPTMQPAPVTQHSEAHQRGEHEGTVVWACYGCQTEEMF